MQEKDSFIVYRSFYDSIKPLAATDQLALLKAIFEFGLNHKEVELDDLPKAMFALIKPQLEANHKRWLNGNKGGRPTKIKPKQNQTKTKPKPNKNVNVNDNVNVNVNKNNNIDGFVPNQASIDAVNSVYPNCDIQSLVSDFKDQARNRAKPFKDLQSGFRNYVRKGWVKPTQKQNTQLSYSEIKQRLLQEQDNISKGNQPSLDGLVNKMRVL